MLPFSFNSYQDQQRRQRYKDYERQRKRDLADRERAHKQRAAEREKVIAERIERNLEENRRKREEAKIAAAHSLQDRIMAKWDAENATSGNPVSEWKEAVSEALRSCHGDRQRAVSMANRKNPGLRQRLVDSVNSGRAR